RQRVVPSAHDVGGAAELEVDPLHEGQVEGERHLRLRVHADDAEAAAGADDVDGADQGGDGADAFEENVGAAAAGEVLDVAWHAHGRSGDRDGAPMPRP